MKNQISKRREFVKNGGSQIPAKKTYFIFRTVVRYSAYSVKKLFCFFLNFLQKGVLHQNKCRENLQPFITFDILDQITSSWAFWKGVFS
jgi:hypothetical protein